MARILILVNDRPAQTVLQAADAHAMERTAMQHAISRAGLQPAARVDGRTPVYFTDELRAMMAARAGKGTPGAAYLCDECGHRKSGHTPVLIGIDPDVYGLGRCGVKGCRCGA